MQRYISRELTHFLGRALQDDEERYTLLRKILRTGQLLPAGGLKRGSRCGASEDLSVTIKCSVLTWCASAIYQSWISLSTSRCYFTSIGCSAGCDAHDA